MSESLPFWKREAMIEEVGRLDPWQTLEIARECNDEWGRWQLYSQAFRFVSSECVDIPERVKQDLANLQSKLLAGELLPTIEHSPEARASVQRGHVNSIIVTDREAALEASRQIGHPWYRCQALSRVADEQPSLAACAKLIEEAMAAAYQLEVPNRVTSVAAWPFGVMVRRRLSSAFREHALRVLRIVEQEPHPVRRSTGLSMVLMATLQKGTLAESGAVHTIELLLSAFIEASSRGHGWRHDRDLRDIYVRLVELQWSDLACRVLALIESARVRRQAIHQAGSLPSGS